MSKLEFVLACTVLTLAVTGLLAVIGALFLDYYELLLKHL